MRIAVYSDIHANLPAYEAVLEDIKKQNVDAGYNLGDIVGYGPFPKETCALAESTGHTTILGNHDQAVIQQVDSLKTFIPEHQTLAYRFNDVARHSAIWSAKTLAGSETFLRNLPLKTFLPGTQYMHAAPYSYADTPVLDDNGFILPDEYVSVLGHDWYYLSEPADAAFAYTILPPATLAFFGHSHVPFAHQEHDVFPNSLAFNGSRDKKILLPNKSALINVGSVGQPRDNIADACYVIYDTDTREVLYRTIPYDIERTRKALWDIGTGWAESLSARLLSGR